MERLYPQDAPFSTTVIPRGADRFLTQEEVDAANLLYPVPPYGDTYVSPEPPIPPSTQSLKFVRLSNVVSDGQRSWVDLSPEDEAKLAGRDTLTVWPIAGRAGILDDLPARAVRIVNREPGKMRINLDTDGLNLTDLVLLGVLYAPV
jgi:hypothetical protein